MVHTTEQMRTSWAFNWKAKGRSAKALQEMDRQLFRFAAVLDEDERDLLSATRFDAESFLVSIESQSVRNYTWRALRSFYGFVAEEEETPSFMVRVKAPKVDLTEVSTVSEADYEALIKACSPFRTATDARDAAIIAVWNGSAP